MKRLWNRVLASSCVAGTLFVASCAHNDSSLFIRQVMAPTGGATGGGECTYKSDPTQAFLSSGTIDVAFLASYRPIVLVGSQLAQQRTSDNYKTETSRVSLQGATVTVSDTQGTEVATFSTLASGFIDPASGTSPGYGLTEVTLIDPKTVDALRTQIPAGGTKKLVARFKVFGQTLGGQSVESNEAQFPIDVCLGCLVFRPADATCDQTADLGSVAAPCVVGQDQAIDCRLCRGNPLCN